jgi:hypothetical protein
VPGPEQGGGQFLVAADAELVEYGPEVLLDGVLADGQLADDLPGAYPRRTKATTLAWAPVTPWLSRSRDVTSPAPGSSSTSTVDWPPGPCSREAWTDSQSPRMVRSRTVGAGCPWPALLR